MGASSRTFAIIATLLMTPLATAEVYKWVDEEGITHYSQQPPPGGEAQVISPGVSSPPSAPGDNASGTNGSGAESGGDGGQNGQTETLTDFCRELREQSQLLASDREVKIRNPDDTVTTLDGDPREQRRQQLPSHAQRHGTQE